MTHVIAALVEQLDLPPDGIDLRAELVALQSARLRQALDQAGGDYAAAARLLRMSRLDLARLESRLAGEAHAITAEPSLDDLDASRIPRISGAVEFFSARVIKQYAAEGVGERAIASRLGCNPYLVERVLREQTQAEIVRLDREEKLEPKAIADRLGIAVSRVRRVLLAAEPGAPR